MSVSASAVPGSHAGGGGNLLSSRYDTNSQNNISQQNLSSLIWQVPYDQRKSILAFQQKQIDAQEQMYKQDSPIDDFATAEETDLNEEDLNDDFTGKMSIRALNVAQM